MLSPTGFGIECCRALLRRLRRPAAYREAAALDADPGIEIRLKIAALGNLLAQELATVPASWHPQVIAHVERVLGIETPAATPGAIVGELLGAQNLSGAQSYGFSETAQGGRR